MCVSAPGSVLLTSAEGKGAVGGCGDEAWKDARRKEGDGAERGHRIGGGSLR